MKRKLTMKQRFTAIATILGLSLSWYAHADTGAAAATAAGASANDRQRHSFMGQSLNNTGYVFVMGQGQKDAQTLFCEPRVGHYIYGKTDYRGFEVKAGKCFSKVILGYDSREYRALSAQEYLDELIGPGVAEPVGIAPATTPDGGLLAIIYYRAIKPNDGDCNNQPGACSGF
ncbi:hypothetical protein [Pseudomonas sp. NPDC089569]|uniref:hypothetical protein n=1 Tax=Pseudomonas sp. NPDC089569 TaxID=3390722 RepID=UPI003D05C54A